MRAAIYLRISEDRSGGELGVTRQREDCEKLVSLRGWTLERAPFTDNDISAAGKKNRPAFNALIDEINAGNLDVVVAWTLDRLSRNARDQLALVEACQQRSVTIALVRGSDMDPTTPAGRLTLGVLGSVAAHEIEVKSERTQRATQQAASMGKWTGGRRPFGFERDGVTVREDEAKALREAYEAVLSGGSLRSVVERWTALGLRSGQTPGESPRWRTTTIKRILANPRYAGIRSYQGQEYGTATWPALVPLEVFRAVQDVLRRHQPQGPPRRQLLSGLALCGNPLCGHSVHASVNYRNDAIYRCSSSTDSKNTFLPPADGPHPNRRAQPCDDRVKAQVLWWVSQPDAWSRIQDDTDEVDLTELRREAGLLQRRLEELATEFDPTLPLREYKVMTQATRDRLSAVEAKLVSTTRNRALSQLVRAEDAEAAWEGLELEQKRGVVSDLMTVTLLPVGAGSRLFRPETVVIEWNE